MRAYLAFAGALLLAALAGFPQEKQEKKEAPKAEAESKVPPEEAKRENPVKPSEASITLGKKLYGYDCAMCHGTNGDGKSELAEQMKLSLRDLGNPATLKDRTDGEIFYIINKGKGKMPSDEDRMKPDQIWSIVNFVRSLAKKEPASPARQ
jgi:mono/diheme cytochrome c family protein